jgi:hypothetical protein
LAAQAITGARPIRIGHRKAYGIAARSQALYATIEDAVFFQPFGGILINRQFDETTGHGRLYRKAAHDKHQEKGQF